MKKMTLLVTDWCIKNTLKFQCKLHRENDMFCAQDQSDPENMPVKVRIGKGKNINNNIEMNLQEMFQKMLAKCCWNYERKTT